MHRGTTVWELGEKTAVDTPRREASGGASPAHIWIFFTPGPWNCETTNFGHLRPHERVRTGAIEGEGGDFSGWAGTTSLVIRASPEEQRGVGRF